MSSLSDSSAVTVRFPDDLEIAEAALEGDEEAAGAVKELLLERSLGGWLVSRGASPAQAEELLGDILGDCFGGEKKRGGQHRLLGRFNGACTLQSFLRQVALNRLISIKRRVEARVTESLDAEPDEDGAARPEPAGNLQSGIEGDEYPEDTLVNLLQEAVLAAFAQVDQEKFVMFRLCHSYRIPQKKIGEMWGWHYSKVSRNLSTLGESLMGLILEHLKESDPWLHLEWQDFLELCQGSIDLFDY